MNDDLGKFPTPPSLSPAPTTNTPYTPPAFEPTPDEIPSAVSPQNSSTPETKFEPAPTNDTPNPLTSTQPADNFFPEVDSNVETHPPTTTEAPTTSMYQSEPLLAATPPTTSSSPKSIISIILLLVAGIGISGSVFLYSQSAALRKQLSDITKTLDQQKTIITPSPTPSIIDVPTPTPTAVATEEANLTPTPTATATPTTTTLKDIIPLAMAPQALKVAINHEPNAQLILIKSENTTDTTNSLTKYFFRKDLTTKKYFYVSINGKNESEINDNAIYVSPDNNIPSLNDLVLGNKLGIDYKAAYDIATKLYTTDCSSYSANAQYIMAGTNTIWQITIDPTGKKFIVQINSVTKEVLYKSPNI